MLEFNTAFDKEILVIELEGSLDSHSAADFRAWFNEKIGAGYRAFAIDCLCLEFISSAGITALIDVQNLLQNQGGKVVLFQLSGETRQLLRFLQLEKKIQLVADYDDAIAALTGIKKVIKPQAPAMVALDDLKVLPTEAKPAGGAAQTKAEEPAAEKPSETAPEMAAPPKPIEQIAPAESAKVAAPAALQPAPSANEMFVEENFSQDKRGLHPVHAEHGPAAAPTPAAVAPAPIAPEAVAPEPAPSAAPTSVSPEAQEIRLKNEGSRRLISCPNCKSVLRVTTAGEYLCPACRFRFVYKAGV